MRANLTGGVAAMMVFLSPLSTIAGPTDDLKQVLESDAASLALSPLIAAEIAQSLNDAFESAESAQSAADAPTNRSLFVGPKRAWIVLAERKRLLDAEKAFADYRAAGVNVALLELRDGGYELALWPRPVGQARRALRNWRKSSFSTGAAPRLSSGAGYLARLTPDFAK